MLKIWMKGTENFNKCLHEKQLHAEYSFIIKIKLHNLLENLVIFFQLHSFLSLN